MSGPPAPVARARTAVKAALSMRIEHLADASRADLHPRVLVAVSGGADSLALAATTLWVAQRMGLETHALIVDHGLQEGSHEVAQRALAQCEHAGLDARIATVTVCDGPGGLEQRARLARYEALEAHARDLGALAVFTGHTLSDQAEQVLLALARGSGARALAGIPRVRGIVVRPFLGTGRDETTGLFREDTEAICEALGYEPWSDPMNEHLEFLRARVRATTLPMLAHTLGEQVPINLVRTADLLADDADFLDAYAAEEYEALQRNSDQADALISLDAHQLASRPRALRTRIIKRAIEEAARAAGTPSGKSLIRRQILHVDALVSAYRGQGPILLPGRIGAERRDALIVFSPASPRRTSHDPASPHQR